MGGHGRSLLWVSGKNMCYVSDFRSLSSSDQSDGSQLRMVFGSTTCDRKSGSGTGRALSFELFRANHRKQNVFTRDDYVNQFEKESLQEDIENGVCESREYLATKRDDTNDIALIKLPKPFSDIDLKYEKTHINTLCVLHSRQFKEDINNRKLIGYAAGFGFKDRDYLATETEEQRRIAYNNRIQPYLSFLRYTVLGFTSREMDSRRRQVIIPTVAPHTLTGTALDDDIQRQILGVSLRVEK